MDFGTILRAARKCRGLSQEALAEQAGLARTKVCDVECGVNRGTTARVVLGIAEVFGVPPRNVLALVEDPNKPPSEIARLLSVRESALRAEMNARPS